MKIGKISLAVINMIKTKLLKQMIKQITEQIIKQIIK